MLSFLGTKFCGGIFYGGKESLGELWQSPHYEIFFDGWRGAAKRRSPFLPVSESFEVANLVFGEVFTLFFLMSYFSTFSKVLQIVLRNACLSQQHTLRDPPGVAL